MEPVACKGTRIARLGRAGLIFVVFVVGCAIHRANLAERARTELVGMSKVDLVSCVGAPVRSGKVGDMEVLTYVGGGDTIGFAGGGAGSGVGGGAVALKRRYCEVTFVLRNDVVEKINYLGRTGGLLSKGEQCAFVVENCLQER
ncbi:MAG: hypothetical protein ACE1ZE_07695 [Candidatus Binatia bacterium]